MEFKHNFITGKKLISSQDSYKLRSFVLFILALRRLVLAREESRADERVRETNEGEEK